MLRASLLLEKGVDQINTFTLISETSVMYIPSLCLVPVSHEEKTISDILQHFLVLQPLKLTNIARIIHV